MIRQPFGSRFKWYLAFAAVALLVVGGLAWVTVESLGVEAAQHEATALAHRANQERLALWRLDGHLLPALGLENNRPYGHYTALHTQFAAVGVEQTNLAPGYFRFPSPLLSADLPAWMLIHFQLDPDRGWESPQVIEPDLADRLRGEPSNLVLANVGPQRDLLLAKIRELLPAAEVYATLSTWEQSDPDEGLFVVPVPFADEPAMPKPAPSSDSRDYPSQSRPAAKSSESGRDAASERKSIPIPLKDFTRGRGPTPGVPAQSLTELGSSGVSSTPVRGLPDPVSPSANQLESRGASKSSQEPQASPTAAPGGRGKTLPQKADAGTDFALRGQFTQQSQNVGRGAYEIPGPTKGLTNDRVEPTAPMPPATAAVISPMAEAAAKDQAALKQDEQQKKMTQPNAADVQLQSRGLPIPPSGPHSGSGPVGPGGSGGLPGGGSGGAGRTGLPQLGGSPGTNREGKSPQDEPATAKKELDNILNMDRRNYIAPVGPLWGEKKAAPAVQPVAVHLGTIRPYWLTAQDGNVWLVLVRTARMEWKTVYQGIVLDWQTVQRALLDQIADLFPQATLSPVLTADEFSPERAMTALPAELNPGPMPPPVVPGWTPLRFGLTLAWVAAILALTAVGFGGQALISLSERRIRFVSAVTHELRTPLTSLRLYLDLLTSGLVEDPAKQKEYLATLTTESERLNRLIENVLDFAKLEKRSVQTVLQSLAVTDLLTQIQLTWADRCATEGKELVVQSMLPADAVLTTDPRMAAQVLGNLVDNARKYSRDAVDNRIWLTAKPGPRQQIIFEVEDRGPGVTTSDRRSVFRAFRRGETADTTCGGAGLGLALASQWAELLGGTIDYRPADGGVGACFRLTI